MRFEAPDLTHLIADLNPVQKAAVTAPPEHRLVLAGAGSGKTRVLTHRIAWLIDAERVSPMSVLAVTFTNKAANEMRARIEQLVDVPVRAMWVGTFHGIAHRLLRYHWKEAGLVQNFQILDADDQVRLVKRTIKALEMDEEQWPAKTVAGWISAQKEEARRPQHFGDQSDYSQRQLVRVYTAYQQTCERQGVVDFSELLLRAFELCRDNAEIQAHYRRRFRHILVDEFQDTNKLQYDWLRVLAGSGGVMFVVADDDQSIYSWRGAKVENIQKYLKDSGAEVVRLEQNYRSTGTILKAANGLIAHNTGRLGKNLWTDGREGEPIHLYAAFNEYDESEFVINRIKEHLDGRCAHRDLAVLYRTGAQSRVLEETLIRARIPYRIYGGLRFFERMEIKDALSWLRVLHNRDDDVSFERAVGTPGRGIGATTLEKLRVHARAHGMSLWAATTTLGPSLARAATPLRQFQELIEVLTADTRALPLSKATELVIERSGLRDHYRKQVSSGSSRGGRSTNEQAEGRLENLDELVSAARSFERQPAPLPVEGEDTDALPELEPLTAFLTHAALEAGEEQAGAGEDCVQLMTLHAAKGLEFPIVFMVGVEEGMFPSRRSMEEGNLEEERRLCYVGITRARQRLYMSYAELRRVHGVEQIGAPSQFLKEIPAECLVETRPRAQVLRPAFGQRDWNRGGDDGGHNARVTYGARRGDYIAPPRPQLSSGFGEVTGPGGMRLGQQVRHEKFGEGTVLAFDGDGDRARIEVRFKSSGTKWLMLSYANLQLV